MNFLSGRAVLASLAFATLGFSSLMTAAFVVNPTDDAATLAQAILGPGIGIVGTPTLTSQVGQSGLFTDFNSGQYVIPSGIILTSGVASGAMGSYIGGPSYDASGSGDSQLSALSGAATFDADVLTIQFTSANPTLFLNYAFASSEYPSFVGSAFTDAFGVFVNGTNVALLPGTTMPVSVNTVNAGMNSAYFTQYSNPNTPFNYGGVTTLLTARANVSTTSVNTIRLGIADSVDASLDSAVLIQGGSLTSAPEPASLMLLPAGLLLFGAFGAVRRNQLSHGEKIQ